MISQLVFFTLFGLAASNFTMLLMHVNDLHAHLQQIGAHSEICEDDSRTDCYGGFARLKTMVDQVNEEAAGKGIPTVFLNGGDTFQGTPFYTYFKWKIMAEFINMLGTDVMSFGNHDFDDGIEGVMPFVNNITVPVVCANLNTTLEPSMNSTNLMPSYVLTVNGTKVGVIGYLTKETKLISNPGKLEILDEVTTVRAEAQRLLKEGVNVLIALGHSGYAKDQVIAKEVEEIDIVVGAHSHTFLYNGAPPDSEVAAGPYPTVVTQTSGKQVPVVQAYKHSKYLGHIQLNFDDSGNLLSWGGQPILLRGNVTQNATILAALQPYEIEVYAKFKRVVGFTNVTLEADSKCRLGECNFGNLITDAYVDYVTRHYNTSSGWTAAAIGLVNAGEISGSISMENSVYKNGSLTTEDFYSVLYPTSSIVMINATGSDLLLALETAVSSYNKTTGVDTFLQVSGLHVVYNMGEENGSRVVSVEVLCADCEVPEYQPLQLDKTYSVVLPHNLASGETFPSLLSLNPVIIEDLEYIVVAEYIENLGVIYPAIENRIMFANTSANSTTSSTSTLKSPRFELTSVFSVFVVFVLANFY